MSHAAAEFQHDACSRTCGGAARWVAPTAADDHGDQVPQQYIAERLSEFAIRCRVNVASIAINQNNIEMQGG